MDKKVILYYSGVENTKTMARYMYNYLRQNNNIDIYSIEELPEDFRFDNYSKLIIGFPTIHTAPALPMMSFIQHLKVIERKLPTFVYTTCGLYSGNALRILCKASIAKNIIPVYTSSYRCPAVDGILLTPKIKRWYSYEKKLSIKIKNDLDQFLNIVETSGKIPKLKWYSAFNYPNKVIGQHKTFKIYVHEKQCVKCKKCIENCPTMAYVQDTKGLPLFNVEKCINCYRCIHYCPQRALSLSRRKPPTKTLKS